MKRNDPTPEESALAAKVEASDNDANEYLRKYQETMINRKREADEPLAVTNGSDQPLKKVKLEQDPELKPSAEEHDENNDFEWEDADTGNEDQKSQAAKKQEEEEEEEEGFEWEDA